MVALRVVVVLGLVGITACKQARTSGMTMPPPDAAVPLDSGGGGDLDAVVRPDLSIERPPASVEVCGNGLDDDCDQHMDEDCKE